MGEDYGGDGQGYAGEGLAESGQASDYSGSFMSTADLPGIDGVSSLGAGLLDTAQYAYEPSLINDYSPMNVESTMSMSDIYGEDTSFWGRINQFMQSPIGKFGMMALSKANPALGAIAAMANRGYQASQSPAQAGRAIGGMTGSQVGGSIAGLPGSIVGGMIGGWGGQQALGGLSQGYSGPSMGQQAGAQGGSPNMDMMTGGLAGLASLYQGMRNSREIGGQLNGLQSLYGQNSPYAQQLRQALARQDAKSGRRSQYGPREVELQARLAQMASGQAGTMANLMQMRQANRGQSLAQLAGLYQQMGGMNGIRGGLDQLFNGFGGSGNGIPSDMETLAPYNYGNLNPENYYAPIPDIPDFGGDFGG